jgi:hypothetical protein
MVYIIGVMVKKCMKVTGKMINTTVMEYITMTITKNATKASGKILVNTAMG